MSHDLTTEQLEALAEDVYETIRPTVAHSKRTSFQNTK